MKLSQYRKAKGLTLDAIAEKIGRSAATVSRIERGLNKPDWATMLAIEEATNGDVTPNDFRDVEPAA